MVATELPDEAFAKAWRAGLIVYWNLIETSPTLRAPKVQASLKKWAGDRALVDAIRAVVVSKVGVFPRMLGVLAADGSADALDAMMGYFAAAEVEKDQKVNVFRELRHLPDPTPEVKTMLARVEAAFDQRTNESLAHAFLASIGVDATGQFKLSFWRQGHSVEAQTTVGLGVDIDSTQANWFTLTVSVIHGAAKRLEATPAGVRGDDLELPGSDLHPERLHALYGVLAQRFAGLDLGPVTSFHTSARGSARKRLEAWALNSGEP